MTYTYTAAVNTENTRPPIQATVRYIYVCKAFLRKKVIIKHSYLVLFLSPLPPPFTNRSSRAPSNTACFHIYILVYPTGFLNLLLKLLLVIIPWFSYFWHTFFIFVSYLLSGNLAG